MYRISFYVPNNDGEKVKQAMFAAGAGKVGHYSHCAWQTEGTGQFMPNELAKPAIGSQDQLEILSELKIEMVCSDTHIEQTIKALKDSHPYEEVPYSVIKLEDK